MKEREREEKKKLLKRNARMRDQVYIHQQTKDDT